MFTFVCDLGNGGDHGLIESPLDFRKHWESVGDTLFKSEADSEIL
jgi:hypothetical protein